MCACLGGRVNVCMCVRVCVRERERGGNNAIARQLKNLMDWAKILTLGLKRWFLENQP